jgi:hypothetical protein
LRKATTMSSSSVSASSGHGMRGILRSASTWSQTRETPRKPKPPRGVLDADGLATTRPPSGRNRLACRSCRLRPSDRTRLLLAEPMRSPSEEHPGRTSSGPFGFRADPERPVVAGSVARFLRRWRRYPMPRPIATHMTSSFSRTSGKFRA